MPDETRRTTGTAPVVELTDRRDERERRAILDPLVAWNAERAGEPSYRPLNVLVRDDGGAVIGGLWGHSAYGWLVVELLFVPETLRGQGLGRSLVQAAEREALARGCHGAWLDTHEFQARGFYESLGYARFGELPDYPKGYARYFMRKALRRTPTAPGSPRTAAPVPGRRACRTAPARG